MLLLFLLLIGIVAAESAALEIVEVIDDQDWDNSEYKLSYKLNVTKTDRVEVGKEFYMSCKTFGHAQVEQCSWTQSGHRGWMSIDENGPPLDSRNRRVSGFLGNKERTSCDLTIESLNEIDLGTWVCRIEHSSSKLWQEARIEVVPNIRDIDVRLPKNIKPTRYEVHLMPFIVEDNFTIAGHVQIEVTVDEPTANVTLHIYDITVHEKDVTVQTDTGEMVEIVGHGYDEARQFYIIYFSEPQ